MEERNVASHSVTRRSFLKTSALVAGAATFGGAMGGLAVAEAQADAVASEETKYGICHGNCIGGCRIKYTVRDGKVVKSEMAPYDDPLYNRICSKGMSHAQRTYSPQRIMYPMRRVEGTPRGGGEWERISWDEAIDEITTKWKGYIEQYGPSSIGSSISGGNCNSAGPYAYINTFNTLMGFTTIPNQADQAGVQTFANWMGFGMPVMTGNEIADLPNARTIFIWSNNVALGGPHCSAFIFEAKKRGAKVIAIDPNYNPSIGVYADEWVRVRPATDAMLFMGMMHVLLDEGLVDEEFLKTMTVAPYLVKKSDGMFLRAEELAGATVDKASLTYDSILVMDAAGNAVVASETADPVLTGVTQAGEFEVTTAYDLLLKRIDEYPLETCAEVSDVPVERIVELAHEFMNGPTTTLMSWAADHYYNGHTGYEALITLHALGGQMCKHGACITQNDNLSTVPIAGTAEWTAKVGASGGGLDASGNSTGTNLSCVHLKEYFDNDGKINGQDTGITLKSWYISCMEAIGGTANRGDVLSILDKIEFIVAQNIVWGESCSYADIVLPVSYYTEYEDISNAGAFSAPYLVLQDKVVEPMYEGKTDLEICNLLLEGLGMGEKACPSLEEWLRFALEENATLSSLGITLEKLREEHFVRPVYGEDGGACVGLPTTATGRVNLYHEIPTSNHAWPGDYDVEEERMVHWFPPLDAWPETVAGYEQSEISKKYPLNLHWKRSRFATHTAFGMGSHWLDEIDPEPYIRINADDAEARGIRSGDMVRVYNDRGYCIIRAYRDNGLRPGSIDTPQRYQATGCGQYVEGSMLDMCNATTHPFILNANFSETMVEVEKYEEA